MFKVRPTIHCSSKFTQHKEPKKERKQWLVLTFTTGQSRSLLLSCSTLTLTPGLWTRKRWILVKPTLQILTLHQCRHINHSIMEMFSEKESKCEVLWVNSCLLKQPLANYVYYVYRYPCASNLALPVTYRPTCWTGQTYVFTYDITHLLFDFLF